VRLTDQKLSASQPAILLAYGEVKRLQTTGGRHDIRRPNASWELPQEPGPIAA